MIKVINDKLFLVIYLILFYGHWCESFRSPETGVIDTCELSCGCSEVNLGPLEEKQMLLTTEIPIKS